MVSKRHYKELTKKQQAQVKKYTKQGLSQKQIALKLKVAKQRVATYQKKAKIGKRVAGEFWKDVKAYQQMTEETWENAKEVIYHSAKWSKKRAARAGKKWKSYKQRQEDMRKLREEFEGEELEKEMYLELGDYYYGDTPK